MISKQKVLHFLHLLRSKIKCTAQLEYALWVFNFIMCTQLYYKLLQVTLALEAFAVKHKLINTIPTMP